jgi:hypothetical protein
VLESLYVGVALASGAMVAGLLVSAAHVPGGLGGTVGNIDCLVVMAGVGAIVEHALNGPSGLSHLKSRV